MAITQFDPNFFNSAQAQSIMDLLQQMATTPNADGPSRTQAIADSNALVSQGVRQFEQSVLPQITGAAEDAGASGGAMTALLAQEAGISSAGKIAEVQLQQILGAQSLEMQDKNNNMDAITSLLQALMQQDKSKLDFMSSFNQQGNSGGGVNPSVSSPSRSSSEFTINRNTSPTQTVFRGANQGNDAGSVPYGVGTY